MNSPLGWWNENRFGCRVGLLRSGRFTSRGRDVDRLGDAVTSAAQRAKCHLCRRVCIIGTSGGTSVVCTGSAVWCALRICAGNWAYKPGACCFVADSIFAVNGDTTGPAGGAFDMDDTTG